MVNQILRSLNDSHQVLSSVINNQLLIKKISHISEVIIDCFKNEKKIIICGNGGSLCDAMHFAEEFTGRFRKDRKPLPVIALSDPSHMSCVGNDYGFEDIFSRGVQAYGKKGDIFMGLSTSGNSKNIIKANDVATQLGLTTILFLGKNGGQLLNNGMHEIIVPGITTDRIQEVHMTILHIIIECVEKELFPELYKE